MLFTVALLILCSAIIIFFSQEFAAVFKKMFALPGVKILLPLLVLTQLLFSMESWTLFFLVGIHRFFNLLSQGLSSFLPANPLVFMASQIMSLWLLTVLPGWIFNAWSLRKTFKPFPHSVFLGVMLWLLWVILCTLLSS